MPPKRRKKAQLSPRRPPPSTRATRSTLNITDIPTDVVVKRIENSENPLIKLPLEVQEMTLGGLVTLDQPITISKFGRHETPAILQVSHELRQVYRKKFYANNSFRAIVTNEHPDGPSKWANGIATANMLPFIPSFTFEYRLTLLDYRQHSLVLSRTNEEIQQDKGQLYKKCSDACTGILSGLSFCAKMGSFPANIRLEVHPMPDDENIPANLKKRKSRLAYFLKRPIGEMLQGFKGALRTEPHIVGTGTPMIHITTAILRGRAMRNDHWELMATTT